MPKLSVSVPHPLDPQEVLAKAAPAIEKIVSDFQGSGLQLTTTDNQVQFSFRSLAFLIKGVATSQPGALLVEVDLPLAAMAFKEMAEAAIRKNVQRSLTPDAAGPSSSAT